MAIKFQTEVHVRDITDDQNKYLGCILQTEKKEEGKMTTIYVIHPANDQVLQGIQLDHPTLAEAKLAIRNA